MPAYSIPLDSFQAIGKTSITMEDGVLHMTNTRAIHDAIFNFNRRLVRSYIRLPALYSMPLRIDMQVKVDAPALYLLFGAGHLTFGPSWMDYCSMDDPVSPTGKSRSFKNRIPLDLYTVITVIYAKEGMQIFVDGEARYSSTKERYQRAKDFADQNTQGFMLGIACTLHTNVWIKELRITTNYAEGLVPDIVLPAYNQQPEGGGSFESITDRFPAAIKADVIATDAFLRGLKSMKFRRQIDPKNNKITYLASAYGVSYSIFPNGDRMHHRIRWYMVTNSKPELWHKKADQLEAVLMHIEKTDPGLAQRMFDRLNECVGCRQRCLARDAYSFRGKRKQACHGDIYLKMQPGTFEDLRAFVSAANEMVRLR